MIGHAGAALLRKLADQCGLTSALGAALTRVREFPLIDRGVARPARLTANQAMAQAYVLIAGPARMLSVVVRDFTRLNPSAHGHMADRACREDHRWPHMCRSGAI